VNAGTETSDPGQFTAVGDTIYFAASDDDRGRELWKTDGTAAVTVFVKDIRPGGGGSLPNELTAVGGVLYFTAFVPDTGIELWRSDGTAAGTVLVKDINPGGARSDPRDLTFLNGALFFSADDGRNGREPWVLTWDEPGDRAPATGATGPKDSRPPADAIAAADPPRRTRAVMWTPAAAFVAPGPPPDRLVRLTRPDHPEPDWDNLVSLESGQRRPTTGERG
jgi:ELWxxDGT repeat protein